MQYCNSGFKLRANSSVPAKRITIYFLLHSVVLNSWIFTVTSSLCMTLNLLKRSQMRIWISICGMNRTRGVFFQDGSNRPTQSLHHYLYTNGVKVSIITYIIRGFKMINSDISSVFAPWQEGYCNQ